MVLLADYQVDAVVFDASLVDGFFDTPSSDLPLPSFSLAPFFSGDVWVDASVFSGFRLSVMYQPLPLKTTPTGWMTRWISAPHSGQTVNGSSLNF
jgi:hypothetical protein